jgi:integrase
VSIDETKAWEAERKRRDDLAALSSRDDADPDEVQQTVFEIQEIRRIVQRERRRKLIRSHPGLIASLVLVAAGRIARNPARGVNLPKAPKSDFKTISLNEMMNLADVAPKRYRAMILLAGTTGLRFGESG